MKIKSLYLFIIFGFLIACKEDKKESVSKSLNQVVVEAYLYPNKLAEVKLSNFVHYNSEQSLISVENLPVAIIIDGKTSYLHYAKDGKYIADDSTLIQEGRTVQLDIKVEDVTISASSEIPAKPSNFKASANEIELVDMSSFDPSSGTMPTFPDPIDLTWDNTDSKYYLILVDPVSTDQEAVSSRSGQASRNEPTKNNSFRLQSMMFQYYGSNRVVLYKINPEYVALYNNNSNSSQNLTNPPTNVTNGYGIFTGVSTDTLYINVKKKS